MCLSIKKMSRDFIGCDMNGQQKVYLLAWDDMCVSKKEEGIGIRCLK